MHLKEVQLRKEKVYYNVVTAFDILEYEKRTRPSTITKWFYRKSLPKLGYSCQNNGLYSFVLQAFDDLISTMKTNAMLKDESKELYKGSISRKTDFIKMICQIDQGELVKLRLHSLMYIALKAKPCKPLLSKFWDSSKDLYELIEDFVDYFNQKGK